MNVNGKPLIMAFFMVEGNGTGEGCELYTVKVQPFKAISRPQFSDLSERVSDTPK